jgi:23S rRNA (adenine2503-C2)-methyltransferase
MTISSSPSPDKPLIFDLSLSEIRSTMADLGQPGYRADQLWQGLYKSEWNREQDFTNLPSTIRNTLFEQFSFQSLSSVKEMHSKDKETRKVLFALPDKRLVETVWMQYTERDTLCVSSQSGCAMGCTFCATGQMGFFRSLTAGEIVEQVLFFSRLIKAAGKAVKNIVFMGMGEPFHNYDAMMKAVDILNDEKGFQLGARRMTISTVGIVPKIRQFAEEKRQVNLAVSLHAVDNDLRSSMMPVNKKYPVEELLDACHYYVDTTHRRITFEWALIQGINDSKATAQALAAKLKGMICHVNAIPLNPTKQYTGQGSTRERAQEFQATLEENGIPCTIRLRRGIDIQAGCGQLATTATQAME